MKLFFTSFFLSGFFLLSAQEYESIVDSDSLYDMSLEELMNIDFTSVSKKAEKMQNVPSSIYVITANDIERSGTSTLMELFREQVPGYWAVSTDYGTVDAYMRNTFEGSVLVLLDGTPMMDMITSEFLYNFDVPLDEIDRIEFIKGSGGTVYGANAATGVISIYTKEPDKAAKLYGNVKIGAPSHTEVSLGANKKLTDKFSAGIFGKYEYFSGFEQMKSVANSTSVVPKTYSDGDTTITSRYTEDDKTVKSYSAGVKLKYLVSDKLTLSSRLHYYGSSSQQYNALFNTEKSYLYYDEKGAPRPSAPDSAFIAENSNNRLSGNLKADYKIGEKNNAFFQISGTTDDQYFFTGGGINARTSVVDFQIQDNIDLPFNTISVGGNYRTVNYDIYDINDELTINFIDHQKKENLKGLFIQDKISLFNDKVYLYAGIKTENFSQVNDKYYLSPMFKILMNPVKRLTLWAGFTQAYTTPGYIQSNIEYFLFRAKTPETFYNLAYPVVYNNVYTSVYQQAINGGADAATAEALANGYMESSQGVQSVDSITNSRIYTQSNLYPGHYNIAVVNGYETVPTQIRTYEGGVRFQPTEKIYIESNFYYMQIVDGVINSPVAVGYGSSATIENEYISRYYYGNYLKATNMGTETVLKYKATSNLMFEISHSWFSYQTDYQENKDFELIQLSEEQKDLVDEKHPVVPSHVFRAKAYIDLPMNFRINIVGVYGSAFYNKFGAIQPDYQYDQQRFDPMFNDRGKKFKVGENDNRVIVDFRIDKYILNDRLDIYIYASDIASKAFIEAVNQTSTLYPRQVGSMIGLGLNYSIK